MHCHNPSWRGVTIRGAERESSGRRIKIRCRSRGAVAARSQCGSSESSRVWDPLRSLDPVCHACASFLSRLLPLRN